MKSYVSFLQGVYRGIFQDVLGTFPQLHVDLGRDLSRLLSNIESRGLHFAMIDLPSYCKVFERGLDSGRLARSKISCFRGFKRGTPIPRLLKGLVLRVFDISGVLRPTPDIHAISAIRQILLVSKKAKVECNDQRKRDTLTSFFRIERELHHRPEWDYDDPEWNPETSFSRGAVPGIHSDRAKDLFPCEDLPQLNVERAETIQRTFDIISASLGVFDPLAWQAKHGPGAVSDLKGGRSKYDFPTWPDKLERIFPCADFAYANYALWADSDRIALGRTHHLDAYEPPSKLIMVPKTLKGPRLIASEPVSHQWCQQALKAFFATRSSETWIHGFLDFRKQHGNQDLAIQGSRDKTLATIDLSDASDRVSTWLVECLFRYNLSTLNALHASRTRWVVNTIDDQLPKFHKLRKFSCMGSACTFPIQSLLFLGIAIGTILYEERLSVTYRNIGTLKGKVRVFGDDIVVPTAHVEAVLASLALAGLKVNAQKTFYTGRFRESCGVDAYAGSDVTPVYVLSKPDRSRPESVVSLVASQNNFFKKGLFETAQVIASMVRSEHSRVPYVTPDSGAFGLKSLCIPHDTHLKRRMCADTHRFQVRCLQPRGRTQLTKDRGDSSLYQYFTDRPLPSTPWEAGYAARKPKNSLVLRWVSLD